MFFFLFLLLSMTIYFYGNIIENFSLTIRKLGFHYNNFKDYMMMSLKFNGGKTKENEPILNYLKKPYPKRLGLSFYNCPLIFQTALASGTPSVPKTFLCQWQHVPDDLP